MPKSQRLIWIIPEKQGGIRTYSNALLPEIRKGWEGEFLEPIYELPSAQHLQSLQPDLIHIQHEFGLFGSKIPGRYKFPGWVREVRQAFPNAKIIATAHTVLSNDYVYPWRNRGWQTPFRWAANQTLVPAMRPYWREKTWGPLDGVIVHSKLQIQPVRESGCPNVIEIPHFVPDVRTRARPAASASTTKAILVFGFVTPEKGQDILLKALAQVKTPARLIIAGGIRREADRGYLESCERLIADLGLSDKVKITGFVRDDEVDAYYSQAELVVAPFRETSGSGSLAQALARGAPILASDLPLNREIAERQHDSLALFLSEDPGECAREIDRLLGDAAARETLRQNARAYAAAHSIVRTAQRHLEFYKNSRIPN